METLRQVASPHRVISRDFADRPTTFRLHELSSPNFVAKVQVAVQLGPFLVQIVKFFTEKAGHCFWLLDVCQV